MARYGFVATARTAARVAAVFLCALCAGASQARAEDAGPGAVREFAQAFVIEIDGVRRAARAAQTPLPPASLTKIMTGLLVIEAGRPMDEAVRISRHAAAATGSRLRLREGESMRVADLLTATLVASANDACRALAEWHSGSETAFVENMNRRAREMGLRRTRFANACGYDAPGHRSSAGDIAVLARAAMAQSEFARRAGMESAILRSAGGQREFPIRNHNHLIGRAEGAYGVKSGFTANAGKCIVAMARRGQHEVLLVMLNAKNRWWDAHDALDYAFQRAPLLAR